MSTETSNQTPTDTQSVDAPDETEGVNASDPVNETDPDNETGNADVGGVTDEASASRDADADPDAQSADAETEIGAPEFQELQDSSTSGGSGNMSRLQDIKVTVSAELGRTVIPIQKLLSLSAGSVLELDRLIDSPVELFAQGVPLACGEVVVVDGCFAIRVNEVYENNKPQQKLA